MLNAGVLGETALPRFCGGNLRMCMANGRADSPGWPRKGGFEFELLVWLEQDESG